MDEYERRRQELLAEMARRFGDSATTLRGIAARIRTVAQADDQARRRLAASNRSLRDSVGAAESPLPFTRLEYMEFSSADEFRRFRRENVITDADIQGADLDDLARRLQG